MMVRILHVCDEHKEIKHQTSSVQWGSMARQGPLKDAVPAAIVAVFLSRQYKHCSVSFEKRHPCKIRGHPSKRRPIVFEYRMLPSFQFQISLSGAAFLLQAIIMLHNSIRSKLSKAISMCC